MQMRGGRNQAGSPTPNMGQSQPQQGGWGQPQQPAMQSQPVQQPQQQNQPQYNEPPMDFDDDIPF